MFRKLAVLLSALAFTTVSAALLAEVPQINGLGSAGLQRGVANNLTISGANLKGHTRVISPFALTAEYDETDAGNLKVKLTPAADTPVGVYPLRVRTDDGLSNPLLVAVGQVPEVVEVEENTTFDKAQVIPPLCAVSGQCPGNDVDYFKFPGKKGLKIVIDAQCARLGSGLDPQVRLTTAGRAFVASADDTAGLQTDARLFAVLPEDGDYVIEISDSKYQGNNKPFYHLLVGPIPTAEEVFPPGGQRGHVIAARLSGGNLLVAATQTAKLDALPGTDVVHPRFSGRIFAGPGPEANLDVELPAPLVVGDLPEIVEPPEPPADSKDKDAPILVGTPIVINGRLDHPNESDRYVVSVSPGQKLRVTLRAAEIGSALDPQIQVLGPNNAVIVSADDSPLPIYPNVRKKAAAKKAEFQSPDATVEVTVPAGANEITVVVRDLEGRGGVGYTYRLAIVPSSPSYELWLDESEINLAKGSSINVYVTADRAGYNGPITLSVTNPPAGLTVRGATIPEGQAVGLVTLAAADDANFDIADLKVQGEGKGPEGPIVRTARKALVFGTQLTPPGKVAVQAALPTALVGPAPIALNAPAEPVEIAHGGEANVPVKVKRGEGADAGLGLAPLTALPKGVTIAEAKVADKADEGKAAFKADADAPLGPLVVGLEAKGKVAGKDRTYDVPWITLQVVRPITVEMVTPSLAVQPGATVELKGKIVRKGGFKDPVTIKVDGLPKGLKADPVTLEGEAVEFALKVVAEADAADAKADAKVAPAFQINKKDYATPPTAVSVQVEKKSAPPQ